MEVHDKIMQIVKEVLGEEAEKFIKDDRWDWELDSLTFMQMVVLIEEEFNIELPDELLFFEGLETIDKIETFITKRKKIDANV